MSWRQARTKTPKRSRRCTFDGRNYTRIKVNLDDIVIEPEWNSRRSQQIETWATEDYFHTHPDCHISSKWIHLSRLPGREKWEIADGIHRVAWARKHGVKWLWAVVPKEQVGT